MIRNPRQETLAARVRQARVTAFVRFSINLGDYTLYVMPEDTPGSPDLNCDAPAHRGDA